MAFLPASSWRLEGPTQRLLLLAGGHALNDFTAGTLLGHLLTAGGDAVLLGAGFLLYNALAFGGQYPVARWLGSGARPAALLRLAAALNLASLPLFWIHPLLGLGAAGGGSALYHVTGGALSADRNRATEIGLFAAPGIVGLALAGWLAYLQVLVWWPLSIACFIFALLLVRTRLPGQAIPEAHLPAPGPDRHDGLMIALLALIAFRSALWNIFQMVQAEDWTALLLIAGSAALGKVAGGWMADRIGWQSYQTLSLLTAAPILHFFQEEILLLCIGIGLLQSGIPASTALLIRRSGRAEGSALSFGAAVLAGAVLMAPYYFFSQPLATGLLLLLLMAAMLRIRAEPY